MPEQSGSLPAFLAAYSVSDAVMSFPAYVLLRAKGKHEANALALQEEHSPEFPDYDSGTWTIGYRHTLVALDRIMSVSEEEAELLQRLGIAQFKVPVDTRSQQE